MRTLYFTSILLSFLYSHLVSVPRILAPWWLVDGECVAVLEASALLVESFRPFLPILAGYGVLEVFGSAFGIDVQIKTLEVTVACAGELRLLLRCSYCQKVQQLGVELLLSYSDEGVLTGVDLQDHHVAHHVVVDLLIVANMQLVVRLPLDV